MTIYNKVSSGNDLPPPENPGRNENDELAELFSDEELIPPAQKKPEQTIKLK